MICINKGGESAQRNVCDLVGNIYMKVNAKEIKNLDSLLNDFFRSDIFLFEWSQPTIVYVILISEPA